MFTGKYNLRQLEIVEFSERVYHEGLRHKGINGSLYEDILIKFLTHIAAKTTKNQKYRLITLEVINKYILGTF